MATPRLVLKTRWFDRWARKADLPDHALCRAVADMQRGLIDADLGGGLYKKRVARAGSGASGGFRTLLATRFDERWVFVFGFAKNARANVDADELDALKRLAAHFLALSSEGIAAARSAGELLGVACGEKDEITGS